MASTTKLYRPTVISAWVAHAAAWAAGLWLAVGPVYQATSAQAAAPGESPGPTTTTTATLIEVNGLSVVVLLLIAILLTAMPVGAIHFAVRGRALRRSLFWGPAIALSGFCLVAILSVGSLYLPGALALLVAAVLDLQENTATTVDAP